MSKWIDASLQERTVMLQQVAECKGIVDNLQEGVTETTIYLERFFRNMLLGETTPLRNREMHLDWKPEADFQSAKSRFQSENESVQSANPALSLPPKCKNCTLEEIAVLRVIR